MIRKIEVIEATADALALVQQQLETTKDVLIINFQLVKVREGIYEAFGRNSKSRTAFDRWNKDSCGKQFFNLVEACWLAFEELNTGKINPFNNLHLRYVTPEEITANPFKFRDY